MGEKAQRNSWRTQPMSDKTAQLPYTRVLSLEEYERISFGLRPRQMEDKWFIFLEDDWLYLHRSWTGTCVYKVQHHISGSGYPEIEFKKKK